MPGINIPVEAQLEQGSANDVLKDFEQQFNKLGETIARANKLKFTPVDKATVGMIQQVNAGMANLLKVSTDFAKRMKATGQQGAGLTGIDFSKMYPDPNARARQMHKVFEYVTGGGFFSQAPGEAGGGAPGPQPSGARPIPYQPTRPSPAAGKPPSALGRVARAGLGAAGLGGVAEGVAGGAGFGAGAMLAGGLGAIVGLGVAKIIGGARAKIGNAEHEVIGYDTLKRSLGDVNVSFNVLRDSLRETARGLDMTFDESQKLGSQFAKLANLSGEGGAKSLGEEVGVAGGMSRSFGLDPSQGVGLMGTMRQFGVTKNTEDSRKLGLLIGEGIAKAGVFAKADQVLEAIGSYATQQTRLGMSPANVGGYTSMLTGMSGSGQPGTDPVSSALILSKVNSAIQGGGNAGEAGQNFLFRALGSRLGLDPLQTQLLQEQGAFGTGEQTFGADSTYARYAKGRRGMSVPSGAATSTATNLQLVMEAFEKLYKDKPNLMPSGMQQFFGTSMSQSMALANIMRDQGGQTLGGMGSRLKRLGININDVNMSGLSKMGQIEADKNLSEPEKDKQMKEAATRGQEVTEGSRTRATINGVERAIQKMAAEMVGPMNDIRAATMFLAGEAGGKNPRSIRESVARAESADRVGVIDSEFGAKMKALGADRGANAEKRRLLTQSLHDTAGHLSPTEMKKRQAEIAELQQRELDADKKITELREQRSAQLEEEKRRLAADIAGIRAPTSDNAVNNDDFDKGGAGGGRGSLNPGMPGAEGTTATAGAATGGSRSWRNNNPGNIKYGAFAKKNGATGVDSGGYAVFPSEDVGKAAQEALLFQSSSYRDRTLSQAVNAWAPPSENDTASYTSRMLSSVGGKDKKMSEYTPDERARIMETQRLHEGWIPGKRSEPVTPLPEEVGPRETAWEKKRADELKLSGTFHLIDQRGNPAAAPVAFNSRVSLPMPMGMA